jgi:transposase
MSGRKKYDAAFKAKVGLEAVRGEETIAQLSSRHGIHATLINQWKRTIVSQASGLFEEKKGKDAPLSGSQQKLTSQLYAKIGQLTVERDFLHDSLKR